MNNNEFPKWKPMRSTIKLFNSNDLSIRKKVIRNAASNFIKKPKVREKLFIMKGDRCYLCGKPATQIDHKISAYRFAIDKSLDIMTMNNYDNLFPVCANCNARKL